MTNNLKSTRFGLLGLFGLILIVLTTFHTSSLQYNLSPSLPVIPITSPTVTWKEKLDQTITKLTKTFSGKLGVYIRPFDSPEYYSLNAEKTWYIASATKLPVLVEVYRQIQRGLLNPTESITITEQDYVDGAGSTNWNKAGSTVTIQELTERMMIESDNTATDLLIKKVGLSNINQNLTRYVEQGFGPITTLLEVRKIVYQNIHPQAKRLTNMDFITLKNIPSPVQKIEKIIEIINIPITNFTADSYEQAYQHYYQKGFNSSTLIAYGKLLNKIIRQQIINPTYSQQILRLMRRCKTGKNRIKAGLPTTLLFAHKTGTQFKRICDMGIITQPGSLDNLDKPDHHIIVAVCAQNFAMQVKAEKLFAKIGKAIISSGILSTENMSKVNNFTTKSSKRQ